MVLSQKRAYFIFDIPDDMIFLASLQLLLGKFPALDVHNHLQNIFFLIDSSQFIFQFMQPFECFFNLFIFEASDDLFFDFEVLAD